ncbi:phosphate ABC transporter permease PstA [Rhodopirellula sallentina]|uniref:Phosphate transport system permease protein PstA n=1 Tax=Rhodopirellula sallentina SM41 TaxID=1263870 RepID=M5TRV7_9BACT|nr:phosphate ABC transporter permease PstA [Rhodopirellula sallentina]EMI51922.1 phosphate ABC transporter, inner membrane subunit PstA [Rhodopirellula sallentina SM41]
MNDSDSNNSAGIDSDSEEIELTRSFADVDFPRLERSLRHPRTLFSSGLSLMTGIVTVVACIPLFSVLIMLMYRGGKRLGLELLTETPPSAFESGGGFGNAIVGTLTMVGIAALIAVPFGILAAVFLAEFGPKSKTASAVRFCAKLLTGFPSILAGVFAYAAVVLLTGTYSAPAGGIALSILMLPIVLLTAEESIKMVPKKMKEAAIGMGATQTQVVWKVILPTALPGMLTGVMLAVARAAGETAPLLFTALNSNYWIVQDGELALMEPTASLAVLIFNFSGVPFESQIELAWAAALVLVLIVLIINIGGQLLSRKRVLR